MAKLDTAEFMWDVFAPVTKIFSVSGLLLGEEPTWSPETWFNGCRRNLIHG